MARRRPQGLGRRGRSHDEPREPCVHRPVARQPRGHLREPDRRARRGRHGARRSQGRAEPAARAPASASCSPTSTGPGIVRHIWMTFPPAPPERHAGARARGLLRRRDRAERLGAVPRLLRPAARPPGRVRTRRSRPCRRAAASTATCRCRSARHVRVEFDQRRRPRRRSSTTRSTTRCSPSSPPTLGRLHVTFRRENPTVQRRDFVIADGLRGPGRFLGCNVGVRVIDAADWYGEGEVKVYRDGDDDLPTICGTGLEDYVGSAWGMGAHTRALRRRAARGAARAGRARPARLRRLLPLARARPDHVQRPTCGSRSSRSARCSSRPARKPSSRSTSGRTRSRARAGTATSGPGCSRGASPSGSTTTARPRTCTAREPQAVPRVDVDAALADIERRPWETAHPSEAISAVVGTPYPPFSWFSHSRRVRNTKIQRVGGIVRSPVIWFT